MFGNSHSCLVLPRSDSLGSWKVNVDGALFFRVLYWAAWERKCRHTIGSTALKFVVFGRASLMATLINLKFHVYFFPYQIMARQIFLKHLFPLNFLFTIQTFHWGPCLNLFPVCFLSGNSNIICRLSRILIQLFPLKYFVHMSVMSFRFRSCVLGFHILTGCNSISSQVSASIIAVWFRLLLAGGTGGCPLSSTKLFLPLSGTIRTETGCPNPDDPARKQPQQQPRLIPSIMKETRKWTLKWILMNYIHTCNAEHQIKR